MNQQTQNTLPNEQALQLHRSTCSKLGFTSKPDNRDSQTCPLEDLPMERRIEHTLLKVDSTKADIDALCEQALASGFRSVCCLPVHVPQCKKLLESSSVLVVTVLNFPLAGALPGATEFECKVALDAGADEVDFVVNGGLLKTGDLESVRKNAASIVAAANGSTTKAILETGCLTPDELVGGMAAVEAAGVTYAKTSTGFGRRGANVEDIRLMRLVCGHRLGIKASGGIKDRDWANQLVAAGADLIGTSSGTNIVRRL